MKKFTYILGLFLLVFSAYQAEASHLVGGYMSYDSLGREANGNFRYKISFSVYRDCRGNVPLDDEISVGVYLNNAAKDLNQIATIRQVYKSNVEQPGSINCPYIRDRICIEYGLFEGFISLKPSTEGYHLTYTRCCRNVQENIIEAADQAIQGQTYYCQIPGTDIGNSSPSFYGVPSPYMCVNDTNSFLFDAVDREGDSLVYRIMRPYQGGSPTNSSPTPPSNLELELLKYKPGYSASEPFGETGFVSVDPTTGRTLLMSKQLGRFTVGVEVTEYRNGVPLGTIRMDLQIEVIDCIPNEVPVVSSDKGKRFTIEAGEELCFNVKAEDFDVNPKRQIVRLSARGEVFDTDFQGTKATFNDTAAIGSVVGEFCWTPDCDADRLIPYYVYFSVEDNGCPPKFNHLDVEIIVTPFEGALQLAGPEEICRYTENEYRVLDGDDGSTYEWEVQNGIIKSANNQEKVTIEWNGSTSGSVKVREISANGCLGEWLELAVIIRDSPALPVITGKDTVCSNETNLKYSVANNPANIFSWELINAVESVINQNEITLASYIGPSFTVKVTEANDKGCVSDTAEFEVTVSIPNPIISGPASVCPNAEGVRYSVNKESGSTYLWNVTGGLQLSGGISDEITINWGNEGIGSISVTETNRHGCSNGSTIFNVIKSYVLQSEPILGPMSVCEFEDNVPYFITSTNGSVYRWTTEGGTQITGDSSANISVDWGSTGVGKITVVQEAYDNVNDRKCASPPQSKLVIINPKPTANEILGTVEVCQESDSFTYSINGFASSSFLWSINGNSNNIIGQGTNTIKVFWSIDGTFNLSVIETSDSGCLGEVVDTNILVNPKPKTSLIDGDLVICLEKFTNINYSVTGLPNSTYNWNVNGATSVTGAGTNTIVVDWNMNLSKGSLSVTEVSDKGCLGDEQILDVPFDRLDIDLRYVSVGTPDDRMILNWKLKQTAETNQFTLEKRDANSTNPWSTIGTVTGDIFTFIETDINTDENAFDYKVSSINKCDNQVNSEVHTSILLQGIEDENFNKTLDFTKYSGWDFGVQDYSLFEAGNEGSFGMFSTGENPSDLILIPSSGTPDSYRQCYRIRATEQDGENTASWSNEICFYYSPEVYVPNAFSANGDNLNDGFGVRGVAVNEYSIVIFNRWGEKLHESDDIDEKWYPQYRDSDVQMGTYIYLIKYTDYENQVFQRTGTINLLR